MKYPVAAFAVAVLAVVVAVTNVASTEYAEGEGAAQAIDFALALIVTFVFWYGVVLGVGWAYRRLTGRGPDVDNSSGSGGAS